MNIFDFFPEEDDALHRQIETLCPSDNEGYVPTPKEQSVRWAIVICIVALIAALPLSLILTTIPTILMMVAMASGAYVGLFHVFWIIGLLVDGVEAELIGDSTYRTPRLYFVFGPYQHRIRAGRKRQHRQKALKDLEFELGIQDHYPLGMGL